MQENMTLEFKREWNDSAKKTAVAFANTDGGTILVGVDDNGMACGLDNPDKATVQVVNSLTDGIRPDLGLFAKVVPGERDGASIVEVQITRGTDRPYYLSDKGLRPSGVYVRRGASSVPASDAEIRSMIKDSSSDSFEAARSVVQDLTFVEAGRAFDECGLTLGDAQMRTLGFVSEDGEFTNLAWLLSDQCTAETKAAVFEGDTKLNFRTRKEFSGSLLRQFREVAEFLELNNGLRSTFEDGYRRVDVRNYPPVAIREALLNSIVHRDYSFVAPTLISVFDSKIEFVNLGGLPKGLTKADAMMGVSMQRNPRLAQVFYRLKYVEAYGTGIPKMIESYKACPLPPTFEVSDNAFKVVLPSFNGAQADGKTSVGTGSDNDSVSGGQCALTRVGAEETALRMSELPNGFARVDLQKSLGVSQSSAINVLKRLVEAGKIVTVGGGRNTRYVKA